MNDAKTASWLGIDVGGANLKAAHSDGQARASPFAVWKEPERLRDAIADLAGSFPPFDRVAATMTAELCDCYATKREGVLSIVDAVSRAVPGRDPIYWGTDGRFHDAASIRRRPLVAAASNWVALAAVAARLVEGRRAILIDVGSTTTDLIPVAEGRVAARGRTDTERLQTGELVYAGVARTPICALAAELPFQGKPTGLAAELFATTRDVYLMLGDLAPDPTDLATADGRPAVPALAYDRLARMVGADRDGCSDADVRALAGAADRLLLDRLVRAGRRVCEATIGEPSVALVSGSGEFLARRVAAELVGPDGEIVALGDLWGAAASDAACAHALLVLARELGEEPDASGE
jgi:(4-(4-[2-(gamma-L-glutamylamino)ethyl]phenoxymethyl)furan-2-yl)methanamine synthase